MSERTESRWQVGIGGKYIQQSMASESEIRPQLR